MRCVMRTVLRRIIKRDMRRVLRRELAWARLGRVMRPILRCVMA
jgi:hypothetical protein